jgi:MORN repeat protein
MREAARIDSTDPRPLLPRSVPNFAVLALVIIATACGSDARPVEELVRSGDRFLEPETMLPYSGLAFATFQGQPSVVAQRLSLRNGAYHGPFEAYFQNRKLSSKEIYENGVKNGPYQWYFENGQLFEEGTYEQGRLEGPYRAFWETGELYEEGTHRKGVFDGPRRWYMDGRLVELVTYRMGEMEGLYERYLEDGSLDLKGMLFAGNPCGMWIEGDRTIDYAVCGVRVAD